MLPRLLRCLAFDEKKFMTDLERFVKPCLHCTPIDTGDPFLHPTGYAVNGKRPNILSHFCILLHDESGERLQLCPSVQG